MFTGIIEEKGKVIKLVQEKNLARLTLSARVVMRGTKLGDSVCVNGVCLTVTKKTKTTLAFDMMKETLANTTLGRLKAGEEVNLERSLKANSRLGGHFVSGHVDTTGTVKKIIKLKNYVEFRITPSTRSAMKYIVPKGSVCLDGISLTVGEVRKNDFSVYLIPHTLKITTFGKTKPSTPLNIETDLLAKYVLKK